MSLGSIRIVVRPIEIGNLDRDRLVVFLFRFIDASLSRLTVLLFLLLLRGTVFFPPFAVLFFYARRVRSYDLFNFRQRVRNRICIYVYFVEVDPSYMFERVVSSTFERRYRRGGS